MSLQTNKKRMLYFSAISLTDIVLLLLIFFLLSSSFIVQPGIKVNLPKAATGVPDEAKQITVSISSSEQIYLNSERVSKSTLGTKLRQLLAENPQKLVVIQADQDLSLQKAVEVVDIAKLSGAQRFMIATQPGL
ncbi:MAG: biopolymer transporter ExbD [Deferribacteres bacterium]|nr:biopolymer transporter ExbD [candidate division KSB1 bacterium]MCB9508891.1 biopolymer transporter ExbD [Deferribacteres bacterium]